MNRDCNIGKAAPENSRKQPADGIEIVQANLQDMDQLMAWRMEMLEHVFAMPESKMPAGLRGANEQYYKTALADGSHIACFAQLDGETVGCGGVCFQMEMPSPDNPSGRCAYLMNIYTREQYRGRGVGAATVRYLIGQARQRRITKIYLESSEDGLALYRSLGFVPMKDYLHLEDI